MESMVLLNPISQVTPKINDVSTKSVSSKSFSSDNTTSSNADNKIFKNTLSAVTNAQGSAGTKTVQNSDGDSDTEKIQEKPEDTKIDENAVDNFMVLFAQLLSGKISVDDFVSKIKSDGNMTQLLDLVTSDSSQISGIGLQTDSVTHKLNIDDLFKTLNSEISDLGASDSGDSSEDTAVAANNLDNSCEKQVVNFFNEIFSKLDVKSDDKIDTNFSSIQDVKNCIQDILKADAKPSESLKQQVKLAVVNLFAQKDLIQNDTVDKNAALNLLNVNSKDKLDGNVIAADNVQRTIINQAYDDTQKINVNSTNTSDDNKNLKDSGDEFLKQFVSQDDNSKSDNGISKANAFISQIGSAKGNNSLPVSLNKDIKNMVVNRDNFVNDIIKTVNYMEVNNVKNLTVKVQPEKLGQIVINLSMENGAMKANIAASTKEAYNLLNSNLPDFESKVSNCDIKIQNFTVNIYGDTTYFSNQSGSQNENNKFAGNSKTHTVLNDNIIDEPEAGVEDKSNVNILV